MAHKITDACVSCGTCAENCPVEEPVLIFMNRLSDYFFVLARKECINNNGKEIIWDYTCV